MRAAKAAGMSCIAIANTYRPDFLKAADLIIERYDEKSFKMIKDRFL